MRLVPQSKPLMKLLYFLLVSITVCADDAVDQVSRRSRSRLFSRSLLRTSDDVAREGSPSARVAIRGTNPIRIPGSLPPIDQQTLADNDIGLQPQGRPTTSIAATETSAETHDFSEAGPDFSTEGPDTGDATDTDLLTTADFEPPPSPSPPTDNDWTYSDGARKGEQIPLRKLSTEARNGLWSASGVIGRAYRQRLGKSDILASPYELRHT